MAVAEALKKNINIVNPNSVIFFIYLEKVISKSNQIKWTKVNQLKHQFLRHPYIEYYRYIDNIQYMDGVKIGVLTGSLLSTLFGYFLILLSPNK